MGRQAEVTNSCIYDEMTNILAMINSGKTMDEIKTHVTEIKKECAKEM